MTRFYARARKRKEKTPGNPDANLQFTLCACAEWAARTVARRRTIDRETLGFAFWVAGADPAGTQTLVDDLLSDTDRDRLLPDLRRAWGDPQDMASVVSVVHNGAPPARLQRLASTLSDRLAGWAAGRDRFQASPLARHLDRTRRLFGLSEQETEFGFFFSAMRWWEPVQDYFENHLHCDEPRGRDNLVTALGLAPAEMGVILGGKLAGMGILDTDRKWLQITEEFLPFFADPDQAPARQELFRPVPGSALAADDLGIDAGKLDLMRSLLTSGGDAPVHILVYGPPGTGKTTLCRALCAELGLRGFEVLGQRQNEARARRAALAACLEMAAGQAGALVFVDEADQLLNTDRPWFHRGEVMDKGYLNGILELPGSRGIWIVNEHDGIDPAVRRRFAYSLELPPLDGEKRAAMLDGILRRHRIKRHFTAAEVTRLAREFTLAPAVFAMAARVASGIQTTPRACRDAFGRTLEAQAGLQGVKRRVEVRKGPAVEFLECGVNPSRPLGTLVRQMIRYVKNRDKSAGAGEGGALAMLFHGQPGTGKTLTAGHLAAAVGRPVVSRKASEILDPYVGMTERNLAKAFAEAAATGAVLVIDEVDTFLASRSRSRRTWEISMVNELLVQIEQHQGAVICTTNRLDALDPAALRRFALKVEFRALDPAGIEATYGRLLSPLAAGTPSAEERQRLCTLDPLTAADMALVRRNLRMQGARRTTHADLLAALEEEVALKHRAAGPVRVVGF
ncbi:ATP-binding protein [bacterium]|nr:ATP-binding protein [bacterium]